MAREWDTNCLICGDAFSFSDTTYRKLLRRGQTLPQSCTKCEAEFMRERRSLGRLHAELSDAELSDVVEESLQNVALAKLDLLPADVIAQNFESALEEHRANFGVSDQRLLEFYQKLDDPRVQVMLVEAPTGAGKSTFFPYRLLVPPPGIEDPEIFTRNGQIVVTQPRVQATIGIPDFVKQLHGCRLGAGFDIGRKWSKENATDWNCKLVYLTDGTLINWIAGGQLANVSLIMLDEAHERSMNIDLIIGLLTKMLPRYPWLKLVIASATIDKDKFLNFFSKHLRGSTRCEHIVFEGKPGKPVRKHFRCGHVEWEDIHGEPQLGEREKPMPELPYDPDELKPLLANISQEVANKCVEILERMHPSDDTRERGIPGDLEDKQGDVLGFLFGQKSIEEAVSEIRKRVSQNPVLKACVQVLPFYSDLPIEEQRKVISVGKQPPEGITSVIIATNAAETSLTLRGVKHVVETGLINRSSWDTETETSEVKKFIHSQSGCRQRWGRAGRVADGDAWPLYTKEQFDRFPRDTPPAILCSRLEQAVLTAKSAGVDRLEPASFPWLDAPPPDELERAILRLTQLGALDDDGDLTPLGIEIQKLGDDPRYAVLLIMADRFACAVEMATVLPLLNAGRHRLLLSNNQWDTTTKQLVARVHQALISGCRDDLELVLKVFSAWRRSRSGGVMITGSWAWPEIWADHRAQHPLTDELRALMPSEASSLESAVAEATDLGQLEALRETFAQRSPLVKDWLRLQQEGFQKAASETWAKLWFVNHDLLAEIEAGRDERIDRLAVRKKEKERRAINFEALDRVRAMLIWAAPDLCFLRSDEERDDDFLYDRLTDLVERESRLESAAEQTQGDSMVESDAGDEDQWARPPLMLKMSDKSVCRHGKPTAFVALGLQQNKQRPNPNAQEREFINVTFAVKVDSACAREVIGLDAAQLAVYLAKHLPPQPIADDDSEVSPIQERLFLDQRYPVFSQYRYKLIEQMDEKEWRVELVEPVAIWPKSRAIEPQLRGDAEPTVEDEEEVRVTLSPEELETIYGDGESVKIDKATEAEADDPHDSDLEDDEPDEETSGNRQPGESVAGRADDPSRQDEEDDDMGWVPEMADLKWPPTEVILRLNRDALPNEPIAEVTAYEFEKIDDPLLCRSRLILETPTPELCYQMFSEQFDVGDTVDFQVISKRKATNSNDLLLLVREPETGMEVIVPPEELAFIRMADIAETFEEGDTLELVVVSMDPKHFKVQASSLPLIERLHAHICETGGRSLIAEGEIKELRYDRVRFMIDPLAVGISDEGSRLPLLTCEIYSPARRIPLRCELGRQCNLRLQLEKEPYVKVRRTSQQFSDDVQRIVERDPQFRWNDELRRLTFVNNFKDDNGKWQWVLFTHERLRTLFEDVQDAGLKHQLKELYRRSHAFKVRQADPHFESRFPAGLLVRGHVTHLGEAPLGEHGRGRYGKMRLDSGITATIDADEFHDGCGYFPGQLRNAMVLAADTDRQQVKVTFRDESTAAALLKDQLLRGFAARLGMLGFQNDGSDRCSMNRLTETELAQLPQRIAAAEDVSWMAWAQLSIGYDEKGRGRAAIILGKHQATRRDIELQTGTVVMANDDQAFVFAPSDDNLDDAIDGIRRRLRHENCETVTSHSASGEFEPHDVHRQRRLQPIPQIAVIPGQAMDYTKSWTEIVKVRLASLLSFLTGR